MESDLLAIGTGSAASAAAQKCRQEGWSVTVVDERPYGGTCALRGCDPKKVLVGAADLVDRHRHLAGHGVAGEARIEWRDLMAFKRTFTRPVPEDREEGFRRAGIETLHGRARFTAPDRVRVGDTEVRAGHVLIATGARPRPLGIPGEEHVATSTDFLDLDELPPRVVFIGGGYVGFELAHVAARAGAEVTILHRSERPLKNFEPDLVARLVDASREAGIDVRLEAPVTAVEEGDGLTVRTKDDAVACDLAVHAAGRVPDLEGLDLDAGQVRHDKRGVTVHGHLQSVSNPRVYAAGDAAATAGWPLTPVAGMEGHVAAGNMLRGARKAPDFTGTCSVVFTEPPLARVGLTEDEAREQGLDVEVHEGPMEDWYSYRRLRVGPAYHKVLVADGRVVGAHLLGAMAEETINLFALAIRAGVPADELKKVPWAYPTHASDVPYMLA